MIFEDNNSAYEYEIVDDTIIIKEYKGHQAAVYIPDQIAGLSVTKIEKKAFFNTKGAYRIVLPESIEAIGDWAFSHCRDLEEVFLKKKDCKLGRSIFVECPNLKRICLMDTMVTKELPDVDADTLGMGALLAATDNLLGADYLFQTNITDLDEWLRLWDARLFSILMEEDLEGYTQLLLCGEEDYGSKENNKEFFLTEKRKRKVRLAFLRLLYDNGLKENDALKLKQYLLNHTVGRDSDETWRVLKEEHAQDKKYITFFLQIGCVTLDNFDAMLDDLGEEKPELKTYLLRYKQEKLSGSDFFDGLDL